MAKKKKVRKPRNLESKSYHYAGIDKNMIYIGAVHYDYPQQIHLSDLKQTKRLHKWLSKAIEFLESKND